MHRSISVSAHKIQLFFFVKKDFVPNLTLVVRVMQIVFEVASCPWKDSTNAFNDSKNEITSSCTRNILCEGKGFDTCEIFLRSMFLRKKYGGMAG